jgi:hypothetical protein
MARQRERSRAGSRRFLHVVYDVTDLDEQEVAELEFEAVVQAEASDSHPDVPVVAYLRDYAEIEPDEET